jgi:CheY-like chemotaxis protein
MPESDGFDLATWIAQQKLSDAGIIMMLTFPHCKRKADLEKLGVMNSVLKPVCGQELIRTILASLGIARSTPDPAADTQPQVIRAPSRPLKILVAEDTPFNQKFILRLLASWKHQTVLVENGRQALEAFQRDNFDIVLMDVQMPEMDGLETAAVFREREEKFGGHIPIIAMTAHVVKGDRERCLDAGMDEYVSKPIDSDKLFEAIERLTKAPGSPGPSAPDSILVDDEMLLKAFDGDWDFFKEVVDIFLEDYPRLLDNLRTSLNEGDRDTFMRCAHSLKGMLKNFKVDAAADIAYSLEKKGRESDLNDVQPEIDNLTARIVEVDKKLRKMID